MNGEILHRRSGGDLPLLATAIHDGHAVRPEVAAALALSPEDRLREEDPFTGEWARAFPEHVVGLRSRFEFDLNRPPEAAIYRTPADAWGLRVWRGEPPAELLEESRRLYDAGYGMLHEQVAALAARFDRIVVLDLHSYNHRRAGPDGPAADAQANPEVNLGTGTMDRERWAPVVEALAEAFAGQDYFGRSLDVRENVKFRGGHFSHWVHATFPDACSIAIEFKKFFMDEWTGEGDRAQIDAIRELITTAAPPVLDALDAV